MKKLLFLFCICISFLGFCQEQEIIGLNNQAEQFITQKNYYEAEKAYQLAITKVKISYGTSHEYYAIFLSNLGKLYRTMGKYNEATSLYLKALKNTEKNLGKEHSNYGVHLNNLAYLHSQIGDYTKAIPLYIEALKVSEKTVGKNHPNYILRSNDLAVTYFKVEQYENAIPFCVEALELARKTVGENHPLYIKTQSVLAHAYSKNSQYKKELPLRLKSLENTKKTLGTKHLKFAEELNILANLYSSIGKYEKALSLFLEALNIIESNLGKKHDYYGLQLNNLGDLYRNMGLQEKALPTYLEALEILDEKESNTSKVLNNLAVLYFDIGRYKKAKLIYLKLQENFKITNRKGSSDYGTFLGNFGDLYLVMRFNEKAFSLYSEALINIEKTLGKEHYLYGIRLNSLANSLALMKQYEKAISLQRDALESVRKNLGNKHPNYGTYLNNLATIYYKKGEYKKALPFYLEALKNTENSLGKNHSSYGNRLDNLASLYEITRQYKKALPVLKELNNNTRGQIKQSFSFQNEKGKELFIKNIVGTNLNRFSQFNYVTNNLFQEGVSIATNNVLTSKGLLLSSTKNILSQLKSLNQQEINDTIELFRLMKNNINKQLQIPVRKRDSNFSDEQENLELLGLKITKIYSKYFNDEISNIKNWKRNQLKENDVAIEFTHFDIYNKQSTDSTMYVAYLYKKNWKNPKVVNLFEEKQLKKYLSTSGNPNELYKTRGTVTKSNNAQLALADSVYKLVWKSLEKYIDTTNTIYFSPDGLLHKIPFAALPNENNQLISELYDIQQMGSTADIRINTKQPNLNDILLIGGVKYDYKIDTTKKKKEFAYSVLESEELLGDEKNRNISRSGFGYLEGTEKEINDINNLLSNAKRLSGYNATETAFKKLSGNSPSVLHIATHGFFFKKPKEKTKNAELSGEQNSYKLHENPLLRSGLLLANANYAWQNGNNPYEEDDGILTALEISNLDLKNTDIVILSACETGLGDIEGSEGVYGLQRAFKMAGVKTIIMSLWPVPDAETAEFMNLFYTKWKSYNNSKKAFKETQQQMMNKYRDEPQKWAAFVYFE